MMTVEDFLKALDVIVTVALGIWAVYQVRFNNRLERDLHRLTVELDQDIQRLYRARDALIKYHSGFAALSAHRAFDLGDGELPKDFEKLATLHGMMEAAYYEFYGLVSAIDRPKLSELLKELIEFDAIMEHKVERASQTELFKQATEFGKIVAKIHACIAELIAEATKKHQ